MHVNKIGVRPDRLARVICRIVEGFKAALAS